MKDKKEKQIQQAIDQIAHQYSLDAKVARAFLVSVQSQFVLHKPNFKVIVEVILGGNFPSLPSPFQAAEVIRQTWEKNPSRNTKYKIASELSKPLLHTAKRDRYDLLLGTPGLLPEPEKHDRLQSGVVRKSVNDEQRVSPNKLPHCPHGVPIGSICAICEPEKFQENSKVD